MSWIQKPKYPVKEQLPKIEHHEQIPSGAVELARMIEPNEDDIMVLVRQGDYLSILQADKEPRKLRNGKLIYSCSQNDFPLGVLPWFSKALTEFQKPPAEGGLHAGAMTSPDEEVEGEMLCIERAMNAGPGIGGYAVVNWSRKSRLVRLEGHFRPQEVTFADNLLYDSGMLDLVKDLGEKYRRGEL
ncbi:hypothetical protein [Microbulbifer celer]|uniref:Uncharacterized protein n=1 Tax=Microbulbifer celer TaxID=435905 RepID=A0ABW3U7C8_9GAMM|nr:hypothetical protein [Microbulbifer celer]UFN58437.1 hypothetical protein LPW13_05180 [Microbulbifer celer]